MLNKRKFNKIIFRVDANAEIGFGHLSRCLSIAEILKDEFDIAIALQNPPKSIIEKCRDLFESIILIRDTKNLVEEFIDFEQYIEGNEIIVLDGKKFNSNYQKSVKDTGCKLVSIDDLHQGHFYSDVIINRNPGSKLSDYDLELYSRLYNGFKYSMVPIKFQKQISESREILKPDTLFICFGGADPLNITLKAVKASVLSSEIRKIKVVTGSGYLHSEELQKFISDHSIQIRHYSNINQDEMIRVMKSSHIAICPASSIVYEVFCIGLNLVTGYYTDDQIAFSEFIKNESLGEYIGDFSVADEQILLSGINRAICSDSYRKQKQMMDAGQTQAIKAIFETLRNNEIPDNLK